MHMSTQVLASSNGSGAALFVLAKAMLGKSVLMRKDSVGPDTKISFDEERISRA